MKPGNTICIIPSFALSEMRLDDLVGSTAIIVEVCVKDDRTLDVGLKFNPNILGKQNGLSHIIQ